MCERVCVGMRARLEINIHISVFETNVTGRVPVVAYNNCSDLLAAPQNIQRPSGAAGCRELPLRVFRRGILGMSHGAIFVCVCTATHCATLQHIEPHCNT